MTKWKPYTHSSGCTLLARILGDGTDGAESSAADLAAIPQAVPAGDAGLQSHYALDGASPLPALALAPCPGHRVLDLCAAPGGKSLVLAGQLFARPEGAPVPAAAGGEGGGAAPASAADNGGGGAAVAPPAAPPSSSTSRWQCSLLISNDRSGPRRARLRRVLEEFVPKALHREPSDLPAATWGGGGSGAAGLGYLAVTGVDASAWGRGPAAPAWSAAGFERILIDAPCSSERHFLHGAPDAIWSRSRLKRDAELQLAILRNGARLLRVGGRLVYSTCSLAEEENDAVVSKLLNHKRHGAGLALADALGGPLLEPSLAPLLHGVSRTKMGALMLPDRSRFGPLYWAVLERTADGGADGGGGADDEEADARRRLAGAGLDGSSEGSEEEEDDEEGSRSASEAEEDGDDEQPVGVS